MFSYLQNPFDWLLRNDIKLPPLEEVDLTEDKKKEEDGDGKEEEDKDEEKMEDENLEVKLIKINSVNCWEIMDPKAETGPWQFAP